ncbi:hypothetical protein AAC387_Pa12g2285 [Persea americana]
MEGSDGMFPFDLPLNVKVFGVRYSLIYKVYLNLSGYRVFTAYNLASSVGITEQKAFQHHASKNQKWRRTLQGQGTNHAACANISNEHARRGDKSVTKLREKSARAGPQSHHQVNPDEDEDPRLDEIRAQNRLIQKQDELILRLKQQLQEKRGARSPFHGRSHASGPLPRHSQAPSGHGRDLRHVLDSKRRDRVHREEDSSSSHEHVEPKKQRRIPEDEEEIKQWIDQQVKQIVRQNMETAGIT